MQREILFRGKRKDFGEWAYGYFFKHPDGTSSIFVPGEGSFVLDPETVGQYTGLKDRNGNKIFEGDIVNHGYTSSRGSFYHNYEVRYIEKDSCYGLVYIGLSSSEYKRLTVKMIKQYSVEIIGNIHTNKELINS